MSRWDADSDYDYRDAPWARVPRCETPGCEQDQALCSVFCADCLRGHADRASHQRAKELTLRRRAS